MATTIFRIESYTPAESGTFWEGPVFEGIDDEDEFIATLKAVLVSGRRQSPSELGAAH